ncbi:hypothetical protein ScPMuIL_012347 [Solemya velum]
MAFARVMPCNFTFLALLILLSVQTRTVANGLFGRQLNNAACFRVRHPDYCARTSLTCELGVILIESIKYHSGFTTFFCDKTCVDPGYGIEEDYHDEGHENRIYSACSGLPSCEVDLPDVNMSGSNPRQFQSIIVYYYCIQDTMVDLCGEYSGTQEGTNHLHIIYDGRRDEHIREQCFCSFSSEKKHANLYWLDIRLQAISSPTTCSDVTLYWGDDHYNASLACPDPGTSFFEKHELKNKGNMWVQLRVGDEKLRMLWIMVEGIYFNTVLRGLIGRIRGKFHVYLPLQQRRHMQPSSDLEVRCRTFVGIQTAGTYPVTTPTQSISSSEPRVSRRRLTSPTTSSTGTTWKMETQTLTDPKVVRPDVTTDMAIRTTSTLSSTSATQLRSHRNTFISSTLISTDASTPGTDTNTISSSTTNLYASTAITDYESDDNFQSGLIAGLLSVLFTLACVALVIIFRRRWSIIIRRKGEGKNGRRQEGDVTSEEPVEPYYSSIPDIYRHHEQFNQSENGKSAAYNPIASSQLGTNDQRPKHVQYDNCSYAPDQVDIDDDGYLRPIRKEI